VRERFLISTNVAALQGAYRELASCPRDELGWTGKGMPARAYARWLRALLTRRLGLGRAAASQGVG
jgi:hypothetical protein